jgi:uncharacterized protein YjiS (DUF1127 family)
MFADLSHPTPSPLASRLSLLLWRLPHAFESRQARRLPTELGRLSDHQLRDIGVDPRSVRPPAQEACVRTNLLLREWP